MSEWKPIETAPKDGTKILLWFQYEQPGGRWSQGEPVVACYHDADGTSSYVWRSLDETYHRELPRLWQPLPDPPPSAEKE